jgi:hypothetical protein
VAYYPSQMLVNWLYLIARGQFHLIRAIKSYPKNLGRQR